MKRRLFIIAISSMILMPIMAQDFGRFVNGTKPESVIIPSVSYSKDLEKSAKKDNDGSIIMQLADCYMYGLGVDKNEKKAIKLYKEAAEKFDKGEAMLMLADYYVQNEKTELAYDYYKKAADDGCAPALVIYGRLLHFISSYQMTEEYKKNLAKEQSAMMQFDPQKMADYYRSELTKAQAVYDELNKNKEDKTGIHPRYNYPISYESDEHMAKRKAAKQKVDELRALIRKYDNMTRTPQMKDSCAVYAKRIETIQSRINEEIEVQKTIKSMLGYRIVAVNFVEDNYNSYLDFYKKAADQNYPEGMYAYAYITKDYEYMPLAAEAGYYSLYKDLEDHYFVKILNNEDVLKNYSLLKKYSELAEIHNVENYKELITNIGTNTPEQLISKTKFNFDYNIEISNSMLAAMNYSLSIANDTAKLNALIVQSVLDRYKTQQEQILKTLFSTLDNVSGDEKIKFCRVNFNKSRYTDILCKCLNHIVATDKEENNTLGDAWFMLGVMAYNGKIAGIDTQEQKEQKRDECFAKAKLYGNKKAIDYLTIKELEPHISYSLYSYSSQLENMNRKNEYGKWKQDVIDYCRYWMLKGDTLACLDYAKALIDNHEGDYTPQFDSTIIDAYQRAIDMDCVTALERQKAYKFLHAGGSGMQSEFDDIKANGTPLEQMKVAKTLIDIGDDGEKALPILQLALDANSAEAYYQLYKLYYDERIKNNDVHDPAKALEAFEQAVNLGMTDKIPELAEAYIYGIKKKGRDEYKAVSWVKKGHEIGIKECTEQLAWCYARGLGGVPVDFDKAQELMKKAGKSYDFSADKQHYQLVQAANKNDINAIRELIGDYEVNARNYEAYKTDDDKYNNEHRREQLKWIKKGAAIGDSESLRQFGWAYYYGWAGLKIDKNKTLSYLKQAAAKKNSNANYNLGWCYEYGMDGFITPNRQVAAEYYRAAYNYGGGQDCQEAWLRCINFRMR